MKHFTVTRGFQKYIDGSIDENYLFDTYVNDIMIFKFDEISEIFKDKNIMSVVGNFSRIYKNSSLDCKINKLLYLESKTLLPNNNLIKPDRMGMYYGIEARNPFMDYRLFEFNFSYKKYNTDLQLKQPLKTLLNKYDNNKIVPMVKKTFSVPL